MALFWKRDLHFAISNFKKFFLNYFFQDNVVQLEFSPEFFFQKNNNVQKEIEAKKFPWLPLIQTLNNRYLSLYVHVVVGRAKYGRGKYRNFQLNQHDKKNPGMGLKPNSSPIKDSVVTNWANTPCILRVLTCVTDKIVNNLVFVIIMNH